MNIVLAHGFNVRDGGKATIDRLIPFLPKGCTIQQADNGYTFLAKVRLCNGNNAQTIAGMTLPNSVGIGHSNGCARLLLAAQEGGPFSQLVFINPALDNDIEIPEHINRVDVYYTVGDKALRLARFIPFHIWGDMGRIGYTGKDERVFSHNATELFGAKEHSDIFDKVVKLSKHIHRVLKVNCNAGETGRE